MMPRLSNFFRSRDPGGEPVYRPIRRHEIESALRLILAGEQGLAADEQVLDFLAFAVQRKLDLNQIWVASAGDRIAWALLPISSPGKTLLIFTPGRIPASTPLDVARQLTHHLCAHWRGKDAHLAQFLLGPEDQAVRDLYLSCGFERLAELIYLQREVHLTPANPLPPGLDLLNYSPETHAIFAETIQRSYQGSLDCPAMNGMRNIDDVIAGHKAAGGFDPSMWHVLKEGDIPRGVLILSPLPHSESIELVYLGLSPEARHRGFGDALMRLAMQSVVRHGKNELSLAVDSRNIPAMRLYFRHGLERAGTRIAMVRDLRVGSPAPVG